MVIAAMKLKDTCSLEEKLWIPRQHVKKERHHFTNKCSYCQRYGFSSSHVWMWMFDHKEGWVPKNWLLWTVVLENTLGSPLSCKEKARLSTIHGVAKSQKQMSNWTTQQELIMMYLDVKFFGSIPFGIHWAVLICSCVWLATKSYALFEKFSAII